MRVGSLQQLTSVDGIITLLIAARQTAPHGNHWWLLQRMRSGQTVEEGTVLCYSTRAIEVGRS